MSALEEYNRSRITRDYTLADRMRDELLKRAEQAESRSRIDAHKVDMLTERVEYLTIDANHWQNRAERAEDELKELRLTLLSVTMPPNAAEVAVQRLRAEQAEARLKVSLRAQRENMDRALKAEAEVAQSRVVLREAIRYFYGGHNIGDGEVCAACEHWVDDFPRMVDAMLKARAEEGSNHA